jgi:hypothetical protein
MLIKDLQIIVQMFTKFLLLIISLVCFSGVIVTGLTQTKNIPAVAKLCGNVVIPYYKKAELIEQMEKEGCEIYFFQHIEGDRYLGYGVRVVIGE